MAGIVASAAQHLTFLAYMLGRSQPRYRTIRRAGQGATFARYYSLLMKLRMTVTSAMGRSETR